MMIRSVNDSQEGIIRDIMTLGKIDRFHLDPTYSKGVFYKNIVAPELKSDINPVVDGVRECDVRDLPYTDGSIRSIMFDPPFVGGGGRNGFIKRRFGGFDSVSELWKFYKDSLRELSRVLKKQGVLVVKCQDIVDSRQQHLSHFEVIYLALELGLYPKDLYVLVSGSRARAHNHKNQCHARKYHSYFIVFKKANRTQFYSMLTKKDAIKKGYK